MNQEDICRNCGHKRKFHFITFSSRDEECQKRLRKGKASFKCECTKFEEYNI